MKKVLSLYLLLIMSVIGYTQNECGSDYIHNKLMQTDFSYRHHYLQMNQRLRTIINNQEAQKPNGSQIGSTQQYTIPIVVHVIHLGENIGTGSNISDAQIQGAINGLNARFANTIGSGLDIQINFCLASRDPNGCPTNGINRVNGSSVSNYLANGISFGSIDTCGAPSNENAIKDLSKWPVSEYYNVWVVNKICGGWSGYAYYPWGGDIDGTVIARNFMTNSSITLTHEVAHGFNLLHTFNGDGGNSYCPIDTNCSIDGDYICDTPPHKQGDCGSTNPCTTSGVWANTRNNYMSYCSSLNRFTSDQKTRMRASLLVFPRANLLNSLGCDPSDFGVSISNTDVSCFGLCDGAITLSPYCPSTYTYQWNTGASSQNINGLCSGNYIVTITNTNNLSASFNVTITQPTSMNASVSSSNISCNGINDGIAMVNVSGGTAFSCGNTFPITIGTDTSTTTFHPNIGGNYNWGAKNQFLFRASELSAQGFTSGKINALSLNIATIAGNSVYADFQLKLGTTNFDTLSSFQSGLQAVFGPQNSTLTTGWNTYNLTNPFVWDGVSNIIVQLCFDNANSGFYLSPVFCTNTSFASVAIQTSASDACSNDTATVTYTERPNLRFSVCNDTLPYSYLWSNGQTDSTIAGLGFGNYTVTIQDANECIDSASTFISQQQLLLGSINNQTNVTCHGLSNGSATVNISGGTSSYSTIWNNGQTGLTASVLSAGLYTATITDFNNCIDTATVIILEPSPLSISIDNKKDVECHGNSTGTINVSGSGGMPGYSFVWSNGEIGNYISNLSKGNYSTTVTDANNCQSSTTITISEPTLLSSSVFSQGSCYLCNASATLTTSGGVLPHTYIWSNGSTQPMINNLCSGPYFYTITDANNCTTLDSIFIEQETPPNVSISLPNDTICEGQSVFLNGAGADVFLWLPSDGLNNNTVATPIASPTITTTYSLIGTNSNGCSDTSSISLFVLQLPSVSLDSFAYVLDNSPAFTLTGGNPSNGTYFVNGVTTTDFNPAVMGLGAHTIAYVYTDSYGCSSTDTSSITVIKFTELVEIVNNLSLSVFPNPNKGAFTVKINSDNFTKVEITCSTVIGQKFYGKEFELTNGELTAEILLQSAVAGFYNLTVTANGKYFHRKLIISE